MSKKKLLVITAPHFQAGADVEDDRVVRTAPIIKWCKKWTTSAVKDYCAKKGWTVVEMIAP